MGVPKFFRYISERYPCLSELAREQHIPDFDNLYLDMNGIIHNCSHPDDTNIHFNITEEQMFKDIFNYIDKLFFLIKPRKLFFMAVDGVAPRAKMNQQRGRRFRSAKEAEVLEKQALKRGEIRQHERFDSNCITPGTEFMARLHNALRYFIKCKVSADPLWQKCRIILSGHNSPGEGEHKIMDYVRYLKSLKNFNPNTRHCLYGLDADLIILGLCTHELHFVILREEVKFGKKTKRAAVEETRFFLLHLGLMREYLELEFHELKQYPEFDIANLIDDWVLMGFLVGNDFIPHLPCLHINTNALPLLYKTYIKVYPTLKGNINERGKLNLKRLEIYFAALTDVEYNIFQEKYADLKYFEAKKSKNGIDEAFDFDVAEINNQNTDNDDLTALIESSREFLGDDENLSDDDRHIMDEFENYKRNYYMNKLNKNNMNGEEKREQAICYITALQWNLDYYYRGVQSWDWYYPHHYAPFISDLKNFKHHNISYNLGKPFLPFQQLLAVLPAASKNLLPAAYRDLMTSASSELIHFYPENFETDLNGKQHEWEAVVLIPFIDEELLLRAMDRCDKNLTASERERNCHGPMFQYDYHSESQGPMAGIYSLKALRHVFCTEKTLWSKDVAISPHQTVCFDLPNAERKKFFPGFPTMKHLKYDFEIKAARVKVFDYCSRNENVILKPLNRHNYDNVLVVAEKLLQQIVLIGWPHLVKAKVVAVSSRDQYIDVDGIQPMDSQKFDLSVKSANEHLTTRMGIELQDFSVMLHTRISSGLSTTCNSQGKVSVTEQWSHTITIVPAQAVVSNISVQTVCNKQFKSIEQLYPENSVVFFLGRRYYGCKGIVLNPSLMHEVGRIKVNISVLAEPHFSEAKLLQSQLERDYVNCYQAAAQLGINSKCLGRLTGSVLIVPGPRRAKNDLPEHVTKFNIGFQFKYIKQQEELIGYAKRLDNHSKEWRYSPKALNLIQEYCKRFPKVAEYLSITSERSELLFEGDVFPQSNGENKIGEIVTWLKKQVHTKAERVPCGSSILEKEVIEKILTAVESLKLSPIKVIKLQINPNLLLKPDVTLPHIYKAKRSIRLFDRVVIVRSTYMVPIGAKGTVIGIYPHYDVNPVRLECVKAVHIFFEILFDNELPNGNSICDIAHQRVEKVPESSVLLVDPDYKLDSIENETVPLEVGKVNSSLINRLDNINNCSVNINKNKMIATPTTNDDFWKPSPNSKMKVTQNDNRLRTSTENAAKANNEDFWRPSSNAKMKSGKCLESTPERFSVNMKMLQTNADVTCYGNTSDSDNTVERRNDFDSNITINMNTEAAANEMLHTTPPLLINHSTDILKDALGLRSSDKSDGLKMSSAGIPSFYNPNKQQQLPQPPLYWRKNAHIKNILNQPNFNQQFSPPQPLLNHSNFNQSKVTHAAGMPFTFGYNMPPINTMSPMSTERITTSGQSMPKFPCIPPPAQPYFQIQQPFINYRNPTTPPTKVGAQHTYENINEESYKDIIKKDKLYQGNSFIPSQVARRKPQNTQLKVTEENSLTFVHSTNKNTGRSETVNNNELNDKLICNLTGLSCKEKCSHNTIDKCNEQTITDPTVRCIRRGPRKPRIAAKFDYAPNMNRK